MPLTVEIPGRETLALHDLLLDQNGTLTDRGELIDGVAERLAQVKAVLQVHLLSADTFGTLDQLAIRLGIEAHRVRTGAEKEHFLDGLDPRGCVAIGNGTNDERMLRAAALGVAVLGPEGTSTAAMMTAHVVCGSILDALDLLLNTRLLVATLRL
jgi:soluble P-type ATPase